MEIRKQCHCQTNPKAPIWPEHPKLLGCPVEALSARDWARFGALLRYLRHYSNGHLPAPGALDQQAEAYLRGIERIQEISAHYESRPVDGEE